MSDQELTFFSWLDTQELSKSSLKFLALEGLEKYFLKNFENFQS